MESQIVKETQATVCFPNLVDPSYQRFDVAGSVPIAGFKLILFTVQIFFFVRQSQIFAKFEA
jgi:hypothetical protein